MKEQNKNPRKDLNSGNNRLENNNHPDISNIDRDHGDLSHGAVGGNFEQEKTYMENQERSGKPENPNRMEEQEAPLKNTDNAYVQVNKDGSPSMPGKK